MFVRVSKRMYIFCLWENFRSFSVSFKIFWKVKIIKNLFFTEHFILLKTIDSNYTVNVAAAQADPAAVTHIFVPWSNVELMAIL